MNALLITGITLWASFNLYIIAPKNFNFSGFNPFNKTEVAKPEVKEKAVPVLENKNNAPAVAPVQPPIENKDEIKNPAAEEKINTENISASPSKENVVEVSGNYFVVAGVFRVPSNAENFLAKLKSDGYENSGSIERENKPTMIFVSQHQQKEEAVQSMQQLKEKGIDSWVFSRRQ